MEEVSGGKIIKVPFQGGAPSITALLGGHIDVSFGYLAAGMSGSGTRPPELRHLLVNTRTLWLAVASTAMVLALLLWPYYLGLALRPLTG